MGGTIYIKSRRAWTLLLAWLATGAAHCQTNASASTLPTLTTIQQIWTTPTQERQQLHRIQTEALIYYFDARWSVVWGECDGKPVFLPFHQTPLRLHPGDRIAIDGWIRPFQERWDWNRTKVTVLESNVPLPALAITNLGNQPDIPRLVSVEGLLDQITSADERHKAFRFIGDDRSAFLNVLAPANEEGIGFGPGDFVRVKCVYSPHFDQDGHLSQVELWAAKPADVTVIDSLTNSALFALPITAIDQLQGGLGAGEALVRVAGRVQAHNNGQWLNLWDDTGQVTVQSEQTLPVRPGDYVEAVGHPYVSGVRQYLRRAFYRLAAAPPAPSGGGTNEGALRLAERIRDLNRQEASQHLPVNLHAVVTWGQTNWNFVYVQDGSGGVQVVKPKCDSVQAVQPGAIVNVRGETTPGDFVPVVTNAVLTVEGFRRIDDVPFITLEQAMTGAYDGQLVEMRGLLRKSVRVRDLARWDMSASSGDFQIWVRNNRALRLSVGSIVRVQGVCAAICNDRHQLTGIELWAGEAEGTHVDEAASLDPFAAPLRPLADLRRFNMQADLDRRVRTSGTVVMQAPGRYLYVEDRQGGGSGEDLDSVLALSGQTNKLKIGDVVEVSGFPGHQGRRFVLREAIFRKIGEGPEPAAAVLDARSVKPDYDGLLVRAEGTLLNVARADGEVRMLIESKGATVQGIIDMRGLPSEEFPPIGSRLELTGIYEIQTDEYNQPRSMHLRLRSWDDVKIVKQPAWWTPSRMWATLFGVLFVFAISVIWGVLISRKNLQLHQAKAGLQAAHDKLEMRVTERTRELREQVAEKERARADLAETQHTLIRASRQAGMAEVATGVLHNVGNVLNSLNVSANLIRERTQRLSIAGVAKAGALLQQNHDRLEAFLRDDPKGRLLPQFLLKLGETLEKTRQELADEIRSLTRNIEHINVIISMQQNYARLGGVVEQVALESVVDDAIAINQGALQMHEVEIVREIEPIPDITVDRNKVLQILINLINNAKHAVRQNEGERRIVISVEPSAPDRVCVRVTDNGMGIPEANLNLIFSQGFTTRKDGHGFGLHSGAISARELGGSLTATSAGVGCGAVFTLDLPVTARPVDKTAHAPEGLVNQN
ncbi:MAG TPA: ATP-binding protein [Verrucomicrobiae bacterium]|jgi:signal transduction histidine kinase|nr:ATP-binding protein [Verrucomicrobiae bacterium]